MADYVTQQDVAEAAGVAQSTVSRWLRHGRDPGHLRRVAIEAAIADLGYQQRPGWGRPPHERNP